MMLQLKEASIEGIKEYRLKEKYMRRTYWMGRKISIDAIKEFRSWEKKMLSKPKYVVEEYLCEF